MVVISYITIFIVALLKLMLEIELVLYFTGSVVLDNLNIKESALVRRFSTCYRCCFFFIECLPCFEIRMSVNKFLASLM